MADEENRAATHEKDDAEIEALIRKELDALGDDDLEDPDALGQDPDEGEKTLKKDSENQDLDLYESSISQYLSFIKHNDEKVNRNIHESEELLKETQNDVSNDQNLVFAKKLKMLLEEDDLNATNEDLLLLRDKAIADLDEEELTKDAQEEQLTVAIYQPELIEEIAKLEEEQSEKLKALLRNQEEQKRVEEEATSKAKEDMAVKEKEGEEKRMQLRKEFETALKRSEETEKKLAKSEDSKLIEEIELQMKETIKEIDIEKEKEEKEFLNFKAKIAEERAVKRSDAVLVIQKIYKGYKARKIYRPKLLELRNIRKRNEQEKRDALEREEKERREAQEKRNREQIEKERKEKERLEKERLEKERLEKERLEKERLEKERLEKERLEKERRENERLEKERLEKEMFEKERLEKERLEKERLEKERLEKERLEKERLERERLEKERLEKERLEMERLEKERLEKERLEKEKVEKERLEKERLEKERLEKERLEKERLEKERLEKERLEKERLKNERLEKERLENERLQKEALEENKKIDEKQLAQRGSTSEEGILAKCKLPQVHDEMRQEWVKSHSKYRKPSKDECNKETGKARSRTRLKKSLASLPEINSALVSKFLPANINFLSCECLALSDLNELRLKGIEECINIKIIKIANCGLEAVECLENCKCLEKLVLPFNKIDTLSLSFHVSLRELSLRGNNMTSTIGLEQLCNLEVLDLSANRITRIGQLSTCKRLQYLDLSENQLLSIKGIENLQNLTDLRVSCNHLGNAKEIEKLPLLTNLDLHSNTINSLMELRNHVLLRCIDFHENDIANLGPIAGAWLPSLERINFAGNSIEEVPSLNHFIMLQSLDLHDNIIKDTSYLLPGIRDCRRLSVLRISGNPVNDVPGLRQTIEKTIPNLLYLDDIRLTEKSDVSHTLSDFEELCLRQSLELKKINENKLKDEKILDLPENSYFYELKMLEAGRQHRNEVFHSLLRHLKEHESFGLEKAAECASEDESSAVSDVTAVKDEGNEVLTNAVVAQGANYNQWTCDVKDQQLTSKISEERKVFSEQLKERSEAEENAAIKIQANYRGYRVRRILLAALASAKQDDAMAGFVGDDDDDDFNYDEEVDLAAFDFDDDAHEWMPGDAPQLPARTPALPPTNTQKSTKAPSVPVDGPAYAWQSCPRTPEPSHTEPIERLNLEISPDRSDGTSTIGETVRSKKKDEIITEWGFQKSTTADLMMKRAKKMNAAIRKKNLLGLTADKRYELIKKLQDTKPNMTVRPPSKRKTQQHRIGYFSVQREMESPSSLSGISTERELKQEMTYSWVCNQAVLHTDAYSDIIDEQQQQQLKSQSQQQQKNDQRTIIRGKLANKSERISLPYMDPAIIAGKNLPLVIASRVASNPALASDVNATKANQKGEKSRSAPNPSKRSPPVFNRTGSSSSRSSSSGSRGVKKT